MNGSLMWAAVGIAAAVSLAACGGDPAPAGGDAGTMPRGAYPSGPFGVTEGAILANHAFTNPDGTPFTLEDGVWKKEDKKLLLVLTASGWCTACIEEQPAIQALHEMWGPKGLAIVEAVFEDTDTTPADAAYAARWKRQHAVTFDVVADTPFVLSAYYMKEVTPMNMLVDVASMKIVKIIIGADPNAVEAIVRARLD